MSKQATSLDKFPHNTPARVESISEGELTNRLEEMGFFKDQSLEIVGKAPFGDPLAIQIGASTVMLRISEARYVFVISEEL